MSQMDTSSSQPGAFPDNGSLPKDSMEMSAKGKGNDSPEVKTADGENQLIDSPLDPAVIPKASLIPSSSLIAEAASESATPKHVPLIILSSDSEDSCGEKDIRREHSPEVLYCGPATSMIGGPKKVKKKNAIDLRTVIDGIKRARKEVDKPQRQAQDDDALPGPSQPVAKKRQRVVFDPALRSKTVIPKKKRPAGRNGDSESNPLQVNLQLRRSGTRNGSKQETQGLQRRKKARTATKSEPDASLGDPNIENQDQLDNSAAASQEEEAVPVPQELLLGAQIIPISNATSWLALTDASVTIAGITRINCYGGNAEISGYRLDPGASQLVIPSFLNESWLTVHGTGDYVDSEEFFTRAKNAFEVELIQPCLDLLKKHPDKIHAILLLTSSNPLTDPVLWHCVKLFPALLPDIVDGQMPKPDHQHFVQTEDLRGTTWETTFPGCYLLQQNCRIECPQVDFKGMFWQKMREELDRTESLPHPVILLCGSKNVGKSTTVRFLVNYLLRRFPIVQCLDADIGQSEFNPPGCVSVHSFDKPVFGPPFARLHKPDVCCYLGEVSPAPIESFYKDGLRHVYQAGRKENVPLIVNTMGWVERLGLNLLQQTATLVVPDLVIELKRPEEPGVAGRLTRSKKSRIVTMIPAVPYVDSKKAFPPFFRRKLSLISYLSQVSPTFGPLNNAVPYRIAFADVNLFFVDDTIPPSHYLTVLVGAYVGLIEWKNPGLVDNISGMNIVRQAVFGDCLGFGIVRGIDVETRMFYLLTPLSENELRRVNLIMRGSISTPEEIFVGQDLEKWHGLVPRLQYRYVFEE